MSFSRIRRTHMLIFAAVQPSISATSPCEYPSRICSLNTCACRTVKQPAMCLNSSLRSSCAIDLRQNVPALYQVPFSIWFRCHPRFRAAASVCFHCGSACILPPTPAVSHMNGRQIPRIERIAYCHLEKHTLPLSGNATHCRQWLVCPRYILPSHFCIQ